MEIRKWNRMTTVQKMCVGFKHIFWTVYQELRETSDLIVEDADMHHANVVRDVVAGLHEYLQKYQIPTENLTTMKEPNDRLENSVQITQQQLTTQLQ